MVLLNLAMTAAVAAGPSNIDPCRHFDAFRAAGVPEKPLRQALFFWRANREDLDRPQMVSIADYGAPSSQRRFYLLDLFTGELVRARVSHGSGRQGGKKHGDPDHDGMLDRCQVRGNRRSMTRPGFYKTGELYLSRRHTRFRRVNGRRVREWPFLDPDERYNGLRLDGLSPGVNDRARIRGVVMHGAWYNDIQRIMGRSFGCPAFTSERAPAIIGRIKGGTLFYSFAPQCQPGQREVDAQVEGWASMCAG